MRMQCAALLLGFAMATTVGAKIKETDYKTDFLVVTSSIGTGDANGGPCLMTLQTMDGTQYFVQGAGTLSRCMAFHSGLHLPGKIVTHLGVRSIELRWQMDEHDKWRLARYLVLRVEL